MSSLFSSPKPNKGQQRAQRRQSQAIEKQTSDAARERGARQRSLQANRRGGSLFARSGAAGIKETLGG